MRRLDILVIGINYAPEVTGIAPYTTGLARRLAADGHRVQVVTSFPHYPAWSFAPGYEHGWRRRELDRAVEVIRVRHPLPKNSVGPGRVLMEAVFAAQAAAAGMRRPDLVLVASPALLSVGTALARRGRRRAPIGVIVQDLYSRAFPETGALGGRGSSWVSRLEAGLLRRADGVAVIHDKFRDSAVALGVPPERITVLRNWSHVTPSTADRGRTRAELGWSDAETVVLHAGNMGHKQGLENVVDAARLADAKDAPVRFVLLGDGARRRVLEERGAGVRRLEIREPLPAGRFEDALAAADLLLLNEKPGICDMCVPGKLTSYFAAGRPVLAVTDPRSGAAEEVRTARGGLLVASGRPEELLDAALALGDDPARRAELGRNGSDYAGAVLDADETLEAYTAWATGLVA